MYFFVVPGNVLGLLGMLDIEELDVLAGNCHTVDTQNQVNS